jgi:hypothetical protein
MIATAVILAASLGGGPISLQLPLDCQVGRTCFIQHYVDHDPTAEAKDYRCGTKTYDGHDGIDIRLPDMAAERAGVNVLAASDGVVLRGRADMADVSVRQTGRAAIAGKECGNGLVISHAGGWETQYCHMKQGSLLVHPGDQVKAGQPLGQVGLSGETEFPHLHLTVRHEGVKVDPFDFGAPMDKCGVEGRSLWAPSLAKALAYRAPEVINAGFSSGPVSGAEIEDGVAERAVVTGGSKALVAYVRAIGLAAGDVQRLELKGPDGAVLAASDAAPLDRSKDDYFMFVGKRLTAARWPAGSYRARYAVRRGGAEVLAKEFDLKL